jgi:hypothetical protein
MVQVREARKERKMPDYGHEAELWTDIGDRHVMNEDTAAAGVAYGLATENRIAAELAD